MDEAKSPASTSTSKEGTETSGGKNTCCLMCRHVEPTAFKPSSSSSSSAFGTSLARAIGAPEDTGKIRYDCRILVSLFHNNNNKRKCFPFSFNLGGGKRTEDAEEALVRTNGLLWKPKRIGLLTYHVYIFGTVGLYRARVPKAAGKGRQFTGGGVSQEVGPDSRSG